ncbi:hypothetical protein [Nocardia abscessus]|uniref:hypothetical protein n=1 Tax=Nocardia abscessus TaxID=120957 RepID=UPI0024569EE3|nr:hypothetical protein [Nocardia abscessus]
MRVRAVRPDDLLVCELEFVDIDIKGPASKRRLVFGADSRVIVHLPPQHVAEQAFPAAAPPSGHHLVPSRISGPTRVVFRVPSKTKPVDYRLEAILDLLNSCTLSIPANAVKGPQVAGCLDFLVGFWFFLFPPAVSPPAPGQTAIELPLRLILSPDEEAGFAHAVEPATDPSGTRVELWHTRLQPRPEAGGGAENEPGRRVRAVWMRRGNGPEWYPTEPKWPVTIDPADPRIEEGEPYPRIDDGEPFDVKNTMSQRDRHDIVHVSGNWRYASQTGTDYIPQPVRVRRLALSALGAWLDSKSEWYPPEEHTSLLAWTHSATQGRDHFVEIVNAGFLYPFGHRAAKVKVTRREFVDRVPGQAPLLLQRTYIEVREPERAYPHGAGPGGQKFAMPLHSIELHTLITPDLADPREGAPHGETGDCHLIVAAGATDPFLFSLTGTDAEQNTLDLVTPLVWVNSIRACDADVIGKAQELYAAAKGHELDARGLPLALAPGPTGDTTFTTHTITFTAPPPADTERRPTDRAPCFWPRLDRAEVQVPALDLVAGVDEPISVRYHDMYADHEFGGPNVGEVIVQLDTPLSLDFSSQGERAGALVQPNLRIVGLSRRLGPVGGPVGDRDTLAGKLEEVALGRFNPTEFFADAKMFGVVPLDQVLWGFRETDPIHKPRIAAVGEADTLVARYVWNPLLKSSGHNNPEEPQPVDPVFEVTADTTMQVEATFDARSDTPQSDVSARIEKFRLNLLGGELTFLRLHFDRIAFHAPPGRKPDVTVELQRIEFVNELSFVEQLRSIIPLDGFADPPALDVTEAGIVSSFSLSLPSLAVGIFSLQNIGLGAGFAVPFTEGAMTVSFAFCTREEPFLLTVSMFGGGGFFGIAIDPAGVQELEAALEFGASVAIDLGVAQGGVHVMAGIYFHDETGRGCVLSGYFRLGGNMSVLGLISASIELYLEFTYKPEGKATGRAEIEVEIDIFLFSYSVTVECERTFAGSASDPTFRELMAPYPDPEQADSTVRPWNQYCQAYA